MERMDAVIVLHPMDSSEQHFGLVGLVIAVGIGQFQDMIPCRNDAGVPQHADTVGRNHVLALEEDNRLVRGAITIRILQNENPVAFRTLAGVLTIVDDFRHPDAAPGINVNTAGAEKHRFRGKRRGFQSIRDIQGRQCGIGLLKTATAVQ